MALLRRLEPIYSLPFDLFDWLILLRESYFCGCVDGGSAATTGTDRLYGGVASSF